MHPFSNRRSSRKRSRLVPLSLALAVATIGPAVTSDTASAQGWRRHDHGNPAAAYGDPRGRWTGRPGLQHGPNGSRKDTTRHLGLDRQNLQHQRAMAGAFQRRPLPGERGFTGVPPAGETRFRSREMVFHVDANVSPQTVEATARKLGLSTVDAEPFSLTGGTLIHFRIADNRPVPDVIRALEAEKIGIAQPNYVFKLQQSTNLAALTTQGNPTQYIVNKLRLPEVHRISIGSDVLV